MIHLITFADANMTRSQQLCIDSAVKFGITDTAGFTPQDIKEEFGILNSKIFLNERGCGYWLWKPYFIYKSLLRLSDGDFLIYADAGIEFIHSIDDIIGNMIADNTAIHLFGNKWNHVDWCKADILYAINYDKFRVTQTAQGPAIGYGELINKKQCQASVIIVRKTKWLVDFIKEWLCYCQIPGLIDDSPSCNQNYPSFSENRHDQAILTSLAIKYNIPLHWWPAVYNDGKFTYDKEGYEADKYPAMFHHHRKRNDQWQS